MPPLAFMDAVPSVAPLQLAFVPEALALSAVGSPTVAALVAVQPLAPVTVTV